jgi:hypothetical protein
LEHGKDVELRCSLVALVRASQIMTDGTKDVVEYGRKQGRRTDAKFFASPRSFLTFSFFEFAISVVYPKLTSGPRVFVGSRSEMITFGFLSGILLSQLTLNSSNIS